MPGTTVSFTMVPVNAGAVEMADPSRGGEIVRKRVAAFWIGKTEVTWDLYDVFALRLDLAAEKREMGADAVSRPSKPYGAPDRGFGHQGYPAMSLTYRAATKFCRWLSDKTGKTYRLPTETEWEYACRAGVLPGGPIADKKALADMAWFWDNADDRTHPVGTRAPNAWGIHDMLGNVAEWCIGLDRTPVVRGGSFNDPAEKVHPAAREYPSPAWQATDPQNPKSTWWLTDGPHVGFRIVREE